MKKTFIFLVSLFVVSYVFADDCFSLRSSAKRTRGMDICFEQSSRYHIPDLNQKVGGFSISGTLVKKSPEYSASVILKDTEGKEYLVMESYEELNSDSVYIFSNYCDETAILDGVVPDSLIVYLHDATLTISCCQTSNTDKRLRASAVNLRREQLNSKIDRINAYNKANRRLWKAGETEMSKLDYAQRKKILGFPDSMSTGGLEYYVGGIFEFGHTREKASAKSYTPYADSFDWRNRHGKNWMTPVRNQGMSNYCTSFATAGCVEAMTNLFFNRKIIDSLSVQELASCSYEEPQVWWEFSISPYYTLEYAKNHGIYDELSYPFINHKDNNLMCNSDIITPNEVIRINDYHSVLGQEEKLKNELINKGPLLSGYSTSGDLHAVVLVGYGTIHWGDTIPIKRYIESNSEFQPIGVVYDSTLIGKTYWVFKNSYGKENDQDGYKYCLFHNTNFLPMSNLTYAIETPIYSMKYSNDDILIEDADGDGYYNWGIGPKPSTCPSWIYEFPDGDDSDSTIATMDSYGNMMPFEKRGSIDTWPGRTYSENETESADLIITHWTEVNVTGSLCMLGRTTGIYMNYGGSLNIDGGVLANADVHMSPEAFLNISNGGKMYMRKGVDFEVPLGCSLEITEGEICGPYKKDSQNP
ncbi:C1 family peptidase [Xylanibacter brevis]|uniref:C1 family peptidase n=1 Tax=Xylanibacter brevis TaxID=83231 RepID=UPI0009DDA2FF|nr:C1 family peptidase [Xylanibacter brevis]